MMHLGRNVLGVHLGYLPKCHNRPCHQLLYTLTHTHGYIYYHYYYILSNSATTNIIIKVAQIIHISLHAESPPSPTSFTSDESCEFYKP